MSDTQGENDALATIPARPAELTLEFLQRMLASSSPSTTADSTRQRVVSFTWKPLEVGVISEVVALHVELQRDSDEDNATTTHKELIAKFLRPEFPFERMFVIESNFYKCFTSNGNDSHQAQTPFPFALPTALYLSNQLIIMERVHGISTYSCIQGCPEPQILPVVAKLAQMHGQFWKTDLTSLSSSAGIGSELSGEAKKEQFPDCWRSFLDDVPLSSAEKDRVASVCESLSENPEQLAKIHNAVASGPQTLIHGDFHAANLLFPGLQDDNSAKNQLWLVDWATCGKGNPMRDLAFFFIVGVRSEHRTLQEAASLQLYYETIQKIDGVQQLTLEQWKKQYRLCVVNQFLILAVYDNLSKHLASNAKSEKLRQELHAHFREVNARACFALLDHFETAEIARL